MKIEKRSTKYLQENHSDDNNNLKKILEFS